MDELQHGRISIRPYDACKRPYTIPMMFFCVFTAYIYMYLHDICQRLDNTRVGANCNSPIHYFGELKIWDKFVTWVI